MENINHEIYMLRLFFSSTMFQQYGRYFQKEFVRDNSRELSHLFETVSAFHAKFPDKDIPSVSDFEAYFYVCYPATNAKEKEIYTPLFQKLGGITPDEDIATTVIRNHRERVRATEIAIRAMEVAEGRADYGTLISLQAGDDGIVEPEQLSDIVSDDLEELLNAATRIPGLRWRLQSLNQSLGSLRKGDFGFIFKRPETGGTTLLASECSYFSEQCKGPIVWFNNEEQGAKVKLRCIQAAFGCTLQQLEGNYAEYSKKWKENYGNKIIIVDRASISNRDIDSYCSKYNPSLVVIDQLDKVKGFTSDERDDLTLTALYQWARELAKRYAPVIGICQAGATAEGKKYLEMDDVAGSKTGKQGEADWILGIGKSHQQGYESLRHFHLCKNKLIGDTDTLPERRHWSWDCILDAELARYRDIK